jgi:zinc/manganese transport system permease protein
VLMPVLSIAFAVTSMVGGILLELGSTRLPITPYVTTLSFGIYVVCRVIGSRRDRRGGSRPSTSRPEPVGTTVAAGSDR